ncbi:MAG: hypothetical protein JSW07_20450 [bacterium]|nr:MAG: hypothetical protein JSW07_20450 [bacterium]
MTKKFEIIVMIKKVVKKRSLQNFSSTKEDLNSWQSRPPEEWMAAVEFLRRQYPGSTTRL